MNLLSLFAPVLGLIIILFFGKNKKVDRLDLELTTHACAKCGNCIAVCPAYLVTKDEALTAKGKIALAMKLADGEKRDTGRSRKGIHVHEMQGMRRDMPD